MLITRLLSPNAVRVMLLCKSIRDFSKNCLCFSLPYEYTSLKYLQAVACVFPILRPTLPTSWPVKINSVNYKQIWTIVMSLSLSSFTVEQRHFLWMLKGRVGMPSAVRRAGEGVVKDWAGNNNNGRCAVHNRNTANLRTTETD